MNKKVVFSIVARNYLSLAYTLGESINQYNNNVDYYIVIADKYEGLEFEKEPFQTLSLRSIGISSALLDEMSFKYNVTEFCTAVKPFCFNYFFKNNYESAIYFDPDICTFSSLDLIYTELETKSIVVTPHFFTPELKYTGTITESLLLHVGGFNFGFIGVSKSGRGELFIQWWEDRLTNYCYQDKIEALHTDQKWGDLIPSFFFKDLFVSEDLGRNMSFWNLHERTLIQDNGSWIVKNKIDHLGINKLLFYHFAGYEINRSTNRVHKNHSEYKFDDFPEIDTLYKWYGDQLRKWSYDKYIKIPYGFAKYDNGTTIKPYHRRLYRRLLMERAALQNPFSNSEDSNNFFFLIKSNNLIPKESKGVDKLTEENFDGFENKVKKLNIIMSLAKKILGVEKYFLLMKFFQRYSRIENQYFLLKEYKDSYTFLNENRQYDKPAK